MSRTAVIAVIVGIGVACVPTIIYPMYDSSNYKVKQTELRAEMDKQNIQPGEMKVWSDPFKPTKKDQ